MDSLSIVPLTPGQQYATLNHVENVKDLQHLPVHVPWWDEGDKPCIVLVRGTNFEERRIIEQKAKDDKHEAALLTVIYGSVDPKFTEQHKVMLAKKHPDSIDALAFTIDLLGKYDAQTVLDTVEQAAKRLIEAEIAT